MLLRSGTTYSPNHLDMEAKLDLILKEIQDQKFRVNRLESKSNKRTLENRNDRRRDESTDWPKINEDDIIRRTKIDTPTFNSILDVKNFSDWITDLDYYFDRYRFTEESRIRFTRMRLIGLTRIYWTSVERVHEA